MFSGIPFKRAERAVFFERDPLEEESFFRSLPPKPKPELRSECKRRGSRHATRFRPRDDSNRWVHSEENLGDDNRSEPSGIVGTVSKECLDDFAETGNRLVALVLLRDDPTRFAWESAILASADNAAEEKVVAVVEVERPGEAARDHSRSFSDLPKRFGTASRSFDP